MWVRLWEKEDKKDEKWQRIRDSATPLLEARHTTCKLSRAEVE